MNIALLLLWHQKPRQAHEHGHQLLEVRLNASFLHYVCNIYHI